MAPNYKIELKTGGTIDIYKKSVMVRGKNLFLGNDPTQLNNFLVNLKAILESTYEAAYEKGKEEATGPIYLRDPGLSAYEANLKFQEGRNSRNMDVFNAHKKGKENVIHQMERALREAKETF